MEEVKKMKCYKRLMHIYKQLIVQVSGLCRPQFLSSLPKCFTQLCRALYGDAILVYRFGAPIWPPEINKNIRSSLFLYKLFLFTWELAYVCINICSKTWNGYTAENQKERLFFREIIMVSRTVKTRKFKLLYFEKKHATGLETCTKIFFVYLQRGKCFFRSVYVPHAHVCLTTKTLFLFLFLQNFKRWQGRVIWSNFFTFFCLGGWSWVQAPGSRVQSPVQLF